MKSSQIAYAVGVVAIAAVGARLPLRESEPISSEAIVADPSSERAPVESSAPVASSAAIEEPPAPPPEPSFCRRAIAPGFTLAQVPDATLRDLILDGAPGKRKARDCLGGEVEYENPIAPRVERFDVGGSHMAVFVKLAKELGYIEWYPGFAAIVRVDPDAVVVEGVGPEQLNDNAMTNTLRLARLEGKRVLLFPHVLSTGESGDFEAAWTVWLPDDHGALRGVGSARSTRSMGNGSISSGDWFGAMDSKLLAGGTLQVEEHWDFVRMGDAGEEHGKKRTVVRTYSLQRGKLVASPKNDPTQ